MQCLTDDYLAVVRWEREREVQQLMRVHEARQIAEETAAATKIRKRQRPLSLPQFVRAFAAGRA